MQEDNAGSGPVTEITTFAVAPQMLAGFEESVQEALRLVRRAEGCSGAELLRCVEAPDTYALVVHWDDIEAHTVTFRGSADFGAMLEILRPCFGGEVSVRHYSRVAAPLS